MTQAYDEASKNVIVGDYARSTHNYHGCSHELVRSALLSTVDLLWAAPPEQPAALLDNASAVQAAVELLSTMESLFTQHHHHDQAPPPSPATEHPPAAHRVA